MKDLLEMKLKEIDLWNSRYSKLEVLASENSVLESRIKDYQNKIRSI